MLGCRKITETEMQTQIQTSILSNVAGLSCKFLYNKLLLSCQPFNNYKEKRYSHEKLNKTVIVQSNLIIGNSMSNLGAVHNRQGPTDTLQGSQNVPATGDFAVYFHIFAG
jgi:hypothetical protein